jgi:hypothetical protein
MASKSEGLGCMGGCLLFVLYAAVSLALLVGFIALIKFIWNAV